MACFIVSAATAAAVEAARRCETHKEERLAADDKEELREDAVKVPLSTKLLWLRNMLLGGVVLLLFEHVWHGEITPWFPFLTAMADPSDTAEMLHEMATVGVGMVAAVTVVWAGICVAADAIVKREGHEAFGVR